MGVLSMSLNVSLFVEGQPPWHCTNPRPLTLPDGLVPVRVPSRRHHTPRLVPDEAEITTAVASVTVVMASAAAA